jgi:hypothetical protein
MSKHLSRMRTGVGACLVPALLASTAPGITACAGGAPGAPPSLPHAQADARPERPTPESVWVEFRPEASDERWSLLSNEEKVLCQLPCARWISPQDHSFLQYEKPGTTRLTRVDVPGELGVSPGGTAIAVARPENPTGRTSTKLILGGLAVALLGVILFPILAERGGDSDQVAIAIAFGSGVPFVAAGVVLRLTSHPAEVTVHAAASTSPGSFIATETPPRGPHVVLTPFGIAGTF